ncbi:MAG: hypothetical protein RLZZ450_6717 [Pseudomonadota bacterium]|jgi:hypothetical protein
MVTSLLSPEAVSTLALREEECSAKRAVGPPSHSRVDALRAIYFSAQQKNLRFPTTARFAEHSSSHSSRCCSCPARESRRCALDRVWDAVMFCFLREVPVRVGHEEPDRNFASARCDQSLRTQHDESPRRSRRRSVVAAGGAGPSCMAMLRRRPSQSRAWRGELMSYQQSAPPTTDTPGFDSSGH